MLYNPTTVAGHLRAAGSDDKPVLDVVAGRATHDDCDLQEWVDAPEATNGRLAVYLYLADDHEWWLAYDADAKPAGEFEGAFHHWSTYSSGP